MDIGIDYAADVLEVMETLKAVAKATPRVLEKPEPFVRFENYGESSLGFSVYFYTTEIFRAENIKSDMRVEIFKALKAKGINIPFPQRVLHIKKEDKMDINK